MTHSAPGWSHYRRAAAPAACVVCLLLLGASDLSGQSPAPRADLRMGMGPNGQLFILNKRDGTIRLVTK